MPFPHRFETLLQSLTQTTETQERQRLVIEHAIRSVTLHQDCLQIATQDCTLLKETVAQLSITQIKEIIERQPDRLLRTPALAFLTQLNVNHRALAFAWRELEQHAKTQAINYFISVKKSYALKYMLFMLCQGSLFNTYLQQPSVTETHATAIMRILFTPIRGTQLFTKIYFKADELAELVYLAQQKLPLCRAQIIIEQIERHCLNWNRAETNSPLLADIAQLEERLQCSFADFVAFNSIIWRHNFGYENNSLNLIEDSASLIETAKHNLELEPEPEPAPAPEPAPVITLSRPTPKKSGTKRKRTP